MKNKNYHFLLLAFIFVLGLFGCSNNIEEEYKSSATFYLNGGMCQGRDTRIDRILYNYEIEEGDSTYIVDPQTLEDGFITLQNHYLEGWYKTMTPDGSFSDKWDFSTDKMGYEGVTLYANWEANIEYKFSIVYIDNEKEVLLGEYKVKEGEAFEDYLNYAGKRSGYSCIGFYESKEDLEDANATEIGSSFTHPGGEESNNVKIYAKYIEGDYKIIRTAAQLISAGNSNMYIVNDIDMGGKTLSFTSLTNKKIIGNNHKIYNFELGYNSKLVDLRISLFQSIKGSTVQDIEFVDFKVSGNNTNSRLQSLIYAPLAQSIESSTITNVKINGEYSLTIEKELDEEHYIIITDRLYYEQKDSTFTDCSISIV